MAAYISVYFLIFTGFYINSLSRSHRSGIVIADIIALTAVSDSLPFVDLLPCAGNSRTACCMFFKAVFVKSSMVVVFDMILDKCNSTARFRLRQYNGDMLWLKSFFRQHRRLVVPNPTKKVFLPTFSRKIIPRRPLLFIVTFFPCLEGVPPPACHSMAIFLRLSGVWSAGLQGVFLFVFSGFYSLFQQAVYLQASVDRAGELFLLQLNGYSSAADFNFCIVEIFSFLASVIIAGKINATQLHGKAISSCYTVRT